MTRLPVRPSGGARRRPSQRRASSRLSPRRALAALVMVVAGAATWGVAASPAFAIRTTDVSGMVVTTAADVNAVLALGSPAPNAFMLATDGLRSSLEAIPSIAGADVSVTLPGTLQVRIVERTPILAWHTGASLLLVDRDGRVIADAGSADASPAARAIAAGLPTVDDRRAPAAQGGAVVSEVQPLLAVGGRLGPIELDVATRLLSLRPADIGSGTGALGVRLDDEDGWTLHPAVDRPWTAVFGFYSATLRPADLVPEQARLLRSLLAGREAQLLRIVLADGTHGTYTTK
ncbi:MAG TPA: FtsQ-type POTRA domain-containing protein [Candidatus Limnocylindrales bacterium]